MRLLLWSCEGGCCVCLLGGHFMHSDGARMDFAGVFGGRIGRSIWGKNWQEYISPIPHVSYEKP